MAAAAGQCRQHLPRQVGRLLWEGEGMGGGADGSGVGRGMGDGRLFPSCLHGCLWLDTVLDGLMHFNCYTLLNKL